MKPRLIISTLVAAALASTSFAQAPNLTEIAAKIPAVGESGQRKLDAGDYKGALTDFNQAVQWSNQLVQAYPQEPAYAANLFFYVSRLAAVYANTDEWANAVKLQESAANGFGELANGDPTEERKRTAGMYFGQLAWYQILKPDAKAALATANNAAAFAPAEPMVKQYRAHALLLNGSVEEAKQIYQAERGSTLHDGQNFRDAVLTDFDEMQRRGIRDSNIDNIRKMYGGSAAKAGRKGVSDTWATIITVAIVGGIVAFLVGIVVFILLLERKRTRKVAAVATSLGFGFRKDATEEDRSLLANSALAGFGRSHVFSNVMEAPPKDDLRLTMFDFAYTTGFGKSRRTTTQTALRMDTPLLNLPSFLLQPENFLTKAFKIAGFNDINFAEHAEFSKRYHLRAKDEAAVRQLFTPAIVQWCEAQSPRVTVEGNGNRLLMYRHGKRPKPEQIDAFLNEGKTLLALFVQANAGSTGRT